MRLLWNGLSDAFSLLIHRDPLVLDAAWRSLWISATAVGFAAMLGITIGSLLARRKIIARSLLVLSLRVGMGLPTVLIGLVGYSLLSRRGPLGGLELLYSPWAIVLGEICLAVPIIATWTHSAIRNLDPRVSETALTLGAGKLRRWQTYLSETRLSILLALLTAFARCISELGIAIMVGGNIPSRTQTLTTATATEIARGEFARGTAMSLILLSIALLVTLSIAWLGRAKEPQ
jgi:tungstate transport system permease protein